MENAICLYWFRRDLRLEDNTALLQALKEKRKVQPLFIFDENILDKLEDKSDRRVSFIYTQLYRLKTELESYGSTLWVIKGNPINVFWELSKKWRITGLYANRDYEPYARARDKEVHAYFQEQGIEFKSYKDQVIFDRDEILKPDGKPYTVFTPYSKRWKSQLSEVDLEQTNIDMYVLNLHQTEAAPLMTMSDIGFEFVNFPWPEQEIDLPLISDYHLYRDFPSVQGTSRLSIHLRFGTVSIRNLVRIALKTNEKWLTELIWRDFYQSILWHFPYVEVRAFKKAYDFIEWRNNPKEFQAWCDGKTGYPIVDAGMRELNQTGFMHNRVRMIVASFLTKHLLIDWRWGEAYFAQKLLDFDLASNNGGWQWAAGSGVDAAPYFRIFNPYVQTERFDSEHSYINQWIPELNTEAYPKPIIEHSLARNRALDVYKRSLKTAPK